LTFRGSRPLLKEALPLGLSQGAINLYGSFAVILLGFLSDNRTVGIYTTAYTVMMVPAFLNTALI
jgi:O-antigen/teichoic acid export membrane protein